MVLTNLKIYSASLYGWNLSSKKFGENEQYHHYYPEHIVNMKQYNQHYVLTKKELMDRVFVLYDGGYIRELSTGITIPCISPTKSNVQELFMIRSIRPYYMIDGSLHEELDINDTVEYLNVMNKDKTEKILTDEKSNFKIMIEFYDRQRIYQKNNEEKVLELAKRIKGSWDLK